MIKVGDRFKTTRSGDCIVIKYVIIRTSLSNSTMNTSIDAK